MMDERGIKTVIVTSLLFGIFHIYSGFVAVMITVIGSLIFGFVYLRHYNLISVTLIHWALGLSAMFASLL